MQSNKIVRMIKCENINCLTDNCKDSDHCLSKPVRTNLGVRIKSIYQGNSQAENDVFFARKLVGDGVMAHFAQLDKVFWESFESMDNLEFYYLNEFEIPNINEILEEVVYVPSLGDLDPKQGGINVRSVRDSTLAKRLSLL
ncbi:MAG: hypothetical protein WCH77_12335 [Planctomycetota bacterium]